MLSAFLRALAKPITQHGIRVVACTLLCNGGRNQLANSEACFSGAEEQVGVLAQLATSQPF